MAQLWTGLKSLGKYIKTALKSIDYTSAAGKMQTEFGIGIFRTDVRIRACGLRVLEVS
jgi:hypothetical protein